MALRAVLAPAEQLQFGLHRAWPKFEKVGYRLGLVGQEAVVPEAWRLFGLATGQSGPELEPFSVPDPNLLKVHLQHLLVGASEACLRLLSSEEESRWNHSRAKAAIDSWHKSQESDLHCPYALS